MTRRLALTVSIFLASAASAFAQTHPQGHPQGSPHDPASHQPMDPALHAALHALMHGSWTGTISSPDGMSSKIDLAVGIDKQGNMTLTMRSAKPLRTGAATHVKIDDGTLRWAQDVAGITCKATAAAASAATDGAESTLKGTMACPDREMTFALHKIKG